MQGYYITIPIRVLSTISAIDAVRAILLTTTGLGSS
jgi:hypothetical protein